MSTVHASIEASWVDGTLVSLDVWRPAPPTIASVLDVGGGAVKVLEDGELRRQVEQWLEGANGER